jgi:hypothetical protein
MCKLSVLPTNTSHRTFSGSPQVVLRTTTVSANHTFQEGGNPAEKLVNVTVGVPDREKVEIYMLKNTTVHQRL